MSIIPLKKLGQNFIRHVPVEILIDPKQVEQNKNKKLYILEIGPGTGNISIELLKQLENFSGVTINYNLVEFDSRVIDVLTSRINQVITDTSKLTIHIHNKDFLRFDFNIQEIAEYDYIYVFGALPYNISKPIIKYLLRQLVFIDKISKNINFLPFRFILQKEVAEDYIKEPPHASFLQWTIFPYVNYKKITKIIPPGNFIPMPKVISAILEFEMSKFGQVVKKLQNWTPAYDTSNVTSTKISDTQVNNVIDITLRQVKVFYRLQRKTIRKVLKKNFKVPQEQISLLPQDILDSRPAVLDYAQWKQVLNVIFKSNSVF